MAKTSVALTAQAIRKELKAAYPKTKFSVRSENYSGGDSINVDYVQTLDAPREKEVETLLSKYEGGHFDGMTDMYEYKSGAGDLTTKYLFVRADIDGLKNEYKPAFMKYWGLTSEDDAECMKRTNRWFYEALSNYIQTVVLKGYTCAECKTKFNDAPYAEGKGNSLCQGCYNKEDEHLLICTILPC